MNQPNGSKSKNKMCIEREKFYDADYGGMNLTAGAGGESWWSGFYIYLTKQTRLIYISTIILLSTVVVVGPPPARRSESKQSSFVLPFGEFTKTKKNQTRGAESV